MDGRCLLSWGRGECQGWLWPLECCDQLRVGKGTITLDQGRNFCWYSLLVVIFAPSVKDCRRSLHRSVLLMDQDIDKRSRDRLSIIVDLAKQVQVDAPLFRGLLPQCLTAKECDQINV